MKFQIRFTDKSGCGSFEYFDADTLEHAHVKAEDVATEYIQKIRIRESNSVLFHKLAKSKMIPTVSVVEYNTETQTAKRGGLKFKLTYCYVQATYKSGLKEYISESYSVKK